jgi:cell division protein ZapA (FtsZ GTPase activity inhibitor)
MIPTITLAPNNVFTIPKPCVFKVISIDGKKYTINNRSKLTTKNVVPCIINPATNKSVTINITDKSYTVSDGMEIHSGATTLVINII